MTDETMSGICWHKGNLCQIVNHRDGSQEYIPIPEIDDAPTVPESGGLAPDSLAPHPWRRGRDTTRVIRNEDTEDVCRFSKLTNADHVLRSRMLEATMVKYFGTSMDTGSFDTKGNTILAEMLRDLTRILAGEWLEKQKVIK